MNLKNKIKEYCCGKSFNNNEQTKLLQESVGLMECIEKIKVEYLIYHSDV